MFKKSYPLYLLILCFAVLLLTACNDSVEKSTDGLESADFAAPTTTVSLAAGTYNSRLSITLSCLDGIGGGCKSSHYRVISNLSDTTEFVLYDDTGPINISSSSIIEYFSVDIAGNTEDKNSAAYIIDYPPMVVNSEVVFTKNTGQNTLSISWVAAVDELSLPAQLEYQLYYSDNNDITTFAEMEANGRPYLDVWRANINTASIDTSSTSPFSNAENMYWNVAVRDENTVNQSVSVYTMSQPNNPAIISKLVLSATLSPELQNLDPGKLSASVSIDSGSSYPFIIDGNNASATITALAIGGHDFVFEFAYSLSGTPASVVLERSTFTFSPPSGLSDYVIPSGDITLDSDQDSIANLQEVIDGTDPYIVNTYTVGGVVAGLDTTGIIAGTGTGIVLKLTSSSGNQNVTLNKNGNFNFNNSLTNGIVFTVSFFSLPMNPKQNCLLSGGQGEITLSDNRDIGVSCTLAPIIVTANTDSYDTNRRDDIIMDVLQNDRSDKNNDNFTISSFTQPKFGNVTLNGDGTLTFSPGVNTPSGPDSFTYTMFNSTLVKSSGIVSLNIKRSWGKTQQLGVIESYYTDITDKNGNYYVVYKDLDASYTSHAYVKKLNSTTNKWEPTLEILTDAYYVLDSKLFESNSGEIFIIYLEANTPKIHRYDINTNSITITEPLMDAGLNATGAVNSYFNMTALNDELGNILLLATVNLPNKINPGSHYELHGRWYDAATDTWLPQHVVLGEVDRANSGFYSGDKFFVRNGNALMIQSAGGSLNTYDYDRGTNSWRRFTRIVNGTTAGDRVNGGSKAMLTPKGEVVALWSQTDPSGQSIQANIYDMTNKTWSGRQQVASTKALPGDAPYDSSFSYYAIENMLVADNGDVSYFWVDQSKLFANTYLNASKTFLAPTEITSALADDLSLSLNPDSQNNFSVIFNTKPSGGVPSPFNLMAARRSPLGVWSNAVGIEMGAADTQSITSKAISSNTGELHTIYRQFNGTTFDLLFNRFENNTWIGSSAVEAQTASVDEREFYLVADNVTNSYLSLWTQAYTDQNQQIKTKIMLNRSNNVGDFTVGSEIVLTDMQPSAHKIETIIDSSGNIYLFWHQNYFVSSASYWFKYYDASLGVWQENIEIIPYTVDKYYRQSLRRLSDTSFSLIYALNSDSALGSSTRSLHVLDYQ